MRGETVAISRHLETWARRAGLVLLLGIAAPGIAFSVEPGGLITVKVKGTEIDVVPDVIVVVTETPAADAKKFASKEDRELMGVQGLPESLATGVRDRRGGFYDFDTPKNHYLYIHSGVEYPPSEANSFQPGDIVYQFIFEDAASRDSFCKMYKLGTHNLRKNYRHVYETSKGYYVQVLAKSGKIFFCPMHPHIQRANKEKCPICAMPLSEGQNFNGSSDSKSGASTVRATAPDDRDAKVQAELAKLSPEDRALAQAQKFCPVLSDNRLGSMGAPIKVMIEGQPVFLCCSVCKKKALADPKGTLKKVAELKTGAAEAPKSVNKEVAESPAEVGEEAEIKQALANLSPEDRALAEAQRFCAVLTDNRLGSMDTPIKLTLDGQTVFLCCDGCEKDAKAKPKETAATAKRLRAAHGDTGKK